jgi:CheY-like chemotaxis protein
MKLTSKPLILIADDDEEDQLLIQEAFDECAIACRIQFANDGAEVIDYLSKASAHTEAAMPELLLLDLNMPRKNGFEVVSIIKKVQEWAHIPVIVLTTFADHLDRLRLQQSGITDLFIKPNRFCELVAIVRNVLGYIPGAASQHSN